MLDSVDIDRLYDSVLLTDKHDYKISDEAIKFGIECMAHVYSSDSSNNLNSERPQVADFTDPAHRCAYLHKYAALHTAMVRDMMNEAVRANFGFFYQILVSGGRFQMCSLGGGPGTDVIGVLAALHTAYGYFDASAIVVDYMFEWSYSFASIMKELGTGWYGAFGNNISSYLDWRYVQANLLKSFKPDVLEALSTASLVTMIKFASAARCQSTRYMIKEIFTAMKPGSLLLFIDNDGGGFYNLIEEAARELNFSSVFGPYRRENYTNNFFKKRRFGYSSCCRTTVTVHILQKPFVLDPYFGIGLLHGYSNYYLTEYRTVIMGNNNAAPRPSLLGSPPTPYRNVIMGSNNAAPKPSLLGSPPTPFLYLGQSPGVPVKSRQSPHETPFARSSPTHTSGADENGNRLGYASAYDVKHDFAQDQNINNEPDFVTSPEEFPQSPGSNHSHNVDLHSRIATPLTTRIVNSPLNVSRQRNVIYTPDSQSRRGKRRNQSCFPLHNFRRNLAKKVHQVKARARSVLKRKSKKKDHPIFNL